MFEIEFAITTVIMFGTAFALYFAVVVIIHEALHIIALRYFFIDYTLSKKSVGYEIAVNDKAMTEFLYEFAPGIIFIIAVIPYVFLMPIFTMMYMSNDFYISVMGTIFLVYHLINFPLEFVGSVDSEYEKKSFKKGNVDPR